MNYTVQGASTNGWVVDLSLTTNSSNFPVRSDVKVSCCCCSHSKGCLHVSISETENEHIHTPVPMPECTCHVVGWQSLHYIYIYRNIHMSHIIYIHREIQILFFKIYTYIYTPLFRGSKMSVARHLPQPFGELVFRTAVAGEWCLAEVVHLDGCQKTRLAGSLWALRYATRGCSQGTPMRRPKER